MKNFWLKIFGLLAILSLSFGIVACKSNSSAGNGGGNSLPSVKLVDFEDTTETVGLHDLYQLHLVGTDTEGRTYPLTAVVKNSENEEVKVTSGKFVIAEKTGYTITYMFNLNGKTQTRVVTLSVAPLKEPLLQVDGYDSVLSLGSSYTIPVATATDGFDGELTPETKVYKVAGNEEMAVEDGAFTPDTAGKYEICYKATNSGGLVAEKRLEVIAYNNPKIFGSHSPQALVDVEVGMKNVFTDPANNMTVVSADSEEIANFTGGYKGNAARVELATAQYYMENTQTMEELSESLSAYSHISFWVAVDGIDTGSTWLIGLLGASDPIKFNNTTNGQWMKLTVKTSEYEALLRASKYEKMLIVYNWIDIETGAATPAKGEKIYFYFGDVTFHNIEDDFFKMDEAAGRSIYNHDTYSAVMGVYKTADQLTHIQGEYKGDAVAVNPSMGLMTNPYTEEQLIQLKAEGYTKITFYIAVDGITGDGALMIRGDMGTGYTVNLLSYIDAVNANDGGFSANEKGQWRKMSITIDDYITFLKGGYYPRYIPDQWAYAAESNPIQEGDPLPTTFWLFHFQNYNIWAEEGKQMELLFSDFSFEK